MTGGFTSFPVHVFVQPALGFKKTNQLNTHLCIDVIIPHGSLARQAVVFLGKSIRRRQHV